MILSLISCNIRFDNPADGQNAWPFRREFLAQTLLQHSAAIIATQEGRYHQLMELKDHLKDYTLVDQHRSWIGERMYPTIFLRAEYFEFLASGDVWLSETPQMAGSQSFDSAFPRLMTWALVQIKNAQRKFLIINTHLDHIKASTRIEQMKVLVKEVKKIWDGQSELLILGDFNDSPVSEVRELLTQDFQGLQDAWKLYHDHEETSHHAFMGELQNGSRIDWILVDQKIEVVDCQMDKSVRKVHFPTDHFPIVCKIKL